MRLHGSVAGSPWLARKSLAHVAGAVPGPAEVPAQVPAPVRAEPKQASKRPNSCCFRSPGNRGPAALVADHGWGSQPTRRWCDDQDPARLVAEADPEAGHPQSPQLAQDSPWLRLPEQHLDGHRGAVQAHLPRQEQELRHGALRTVRARVRTAFGPPCTGTEQSLRPLCATLSPG
jgi:hypothetical protein